MRHLEESEEEKKKKFANEKEKWSGIRVSWRKLV
jgi:hypothetical protein